MISREIGDVTLKPVKGGDRWGYDLLKFSETMTLQRKEEKTVKKLFLIPLAIVLVSGLIFSGCAAPAPAPAPAPVKHKTVELKMWCAWPVTKFASYPQNEIFRDMVNDYGKDINLSMKIIGGPEVFGTYEGVEAQLGGAFDVACIPPPYYLGVVPESFAIEVISLPGWEMREKGIFDLMDKFHQKAGLKYLAFTGYPLWFQGYSKFDTPTPDLTGKTMRTAPIYDPMVKALGGVPVNIPAPEVYEALARGFVDGFYWPEVGITDFAWNEHVKYYWGQHTPYLVDCGFTMNLDKWNTLDKDQQAVLNRVSEELERLLVDHPLWGGRVETDYKKLVIDGPMERINFSDADYKYYVDTAIGVVWETVIAQAPETAQIKEMLK